MARPKGSRNKKATEDKSKIEELVDVEIEFICPKRGKVKQKVKMKRMKSVKIDPLQQIASSDKIDNVDDDGLSIYGNDEELQ